MQGSTLLCVRRAMQCPGSVLLYTYWGPQCVLRRQGGVLQEPVGRLPFERRRMASCDVSVHQQCGNSCAA